MLLRAIGFTLLLSISTNCASLPSDVEDVRSTAQAKLNAALFVARQAEEGVEYVCEIAPDSTECAILSDALTRLYAAAVYIQDGIDAGRDVEGDLQALYSIALKIVRLAESAKRSIA